MLLTHAPTIVPAAGSHSVGLRETSARSDEQGVHFFLDAGNETIRLVRLSGVPRSVPLAALVPIDADAFDRIKALDRLVRALQKRIVPADRRLTPQQKRRHRFMLQATDGRSNGASYRQIANVIYGVDRIRAEHWKTSALRDSVIGLVEGGLAMIAGGYRQLLRHRRQR
ncbi:MAG: DUF2285 domain-containing protein [Devosia sp.]|uniref:DUF2285 domain-containing protein n=1 Tax=Devosia sp. TaxID=1871048 RepID=UPI001A400C7E|nr:DUF2285 domain-containing protein [Devosia sp.]MBL8598936.1 DUF2285 domain-containing protein [Devosia sp.]